MEEGEGVWGDGGREGEGLKNVNRSLNYDCEILPRPHFSAGAVN